jgi:hypothetical protein
VRAPKGAVTLTKEMKMRTLSKKEKKELKLSKSPLRQLRVDLRDQGMTLESFLEVCYNCNLNPLPMLRAKGINVKYYKDTSYCDVSVHHDSNDWVVLNYPDYGSRWNEWYRFHSRYQELINLAEQKAQQGLNRRPHRVINRSVKN